MDYSEIIASKGYCVVDLHAQDIINRNISTKYMFIALILEGSVEYEVNMETVKASAGMRVIYPHVTMLKTISMTKDMHALVLVMDDKFAFESTVGIETNQTQSLFNSPNYKIENQHEWEMLINLVEGLYKFQTFAQSPHSHEISASLFRNLVLVLCEVQGSSSRHDPHRGVYTIADTYFRSFVNLLNDNVKTQHEVTFYASQLKITAKYLAEICKRKSGRKAKEIISIVLIAHLKREIALSGKSMKIIAFEYGFADQSSLGKFFRKMTGVSPRDYKCQCNEIADKSAFTY